MRSSLSTTFVVTAIVICAVGVSLANAPIGSSGNGESDDAASWLLRGRSAPLRLGGEGKAATVSWEIVCRNQTAENAVPAPNPTLAGSCYDGVYMYLFQVQSTAAEVHVTISGLSGFDSQNSANYGEIYCDDENTMELCTNTAPSNIPNVETSTTKTSVTFKVPGKFPSYSAGTPQEGRGLTFYVITNQERPLPIALPQIKVH